MKNAVIFLHGLGDSGAGWNWLPTLLRQRSLLPTSVLDSTNFIFPDAPTIPISANGGYRMPGWFDIHSFGDPSGPQDVEGFLKSCDKITELIKDQKSKGVENIVLGGFSQGAALSLVIGAITDVKLAAVISLSGFCPVKEKLAELHKQTNIDTPFFMGHGTKDEVIFPDYGKQTFQLVKELGYNVKLNFYDTAHSVAEDELTDMVAVLRAALA